MTNIPCLLDTGSFFMLCNENTYLYLMVLVMPPSVMAMHGMLDDGRDSKAYPGHQFCGGNSIASTDSNLALATFHVPPRVGHERWFCCTLCSPFTFLHHVWLCSVVHACPSANTLVELSNGKILWSDTTMGKNNPQGFPRRRHQSRGTSQKI